MLKQFAIIFPEFLLVTIALCGQLAALFTTNKEKLIVNIVVILSGAMMFVTFHLSSTTQLGFNDSFATNNITAIYKVVILLFTIMTVVLYRDYCHVAREKIKIEFITLSLLSTVGAFVALSSRDFLLLFCAMELQALIGYVLAGFSINNIQSSEGALKYFILGVLVSCLSLLGISFIYGFGGSLEFGDILPKLSTSSPVNIGLIIGVILFLSNILFKLSSAPLHSWAPDVYEGSPIYATTYFATVSKIAVAALLLNIITLVIGNYLPISVNLTKIISMFSMIVGACGAIRQSSLKRLMAYSAILNMGYVLLGITLHSEQGNFAALIYMVIYATSVMGFFACLVALLGSKANIASFDSIQGIASRHKIMAAAIAVFMFSMIGIPPLVGFLGKYFLFYQAIKSQELLLALIGIITSVIAAYYYLKVIKTMYFMPSKEYSAPNTFRTNGLSGIITVTACFTLFAAFIPLF